MRKPHGNRHRPTTRYRTTGIPYQSPSRTDLPERLDAVLQVIYLVFNEGYAASSACLPEASR
jgi:RNA polymerase sigma-70 factor, ECF subfamily